MRYYWGFGAEVGGCRETGNAIYFQSSEFCNLLYGLRGLLAFGLLAFGLLALGLLAFGLLALGLLAFGLLALGLLAFGLLALGLLALGLLALGLLAFGLLAFGLLAFGLLARTLAIKVGTPADFLFSDSVVLLPYSAASLREPKPTKCCTFDDLSPYFKLTADSAADLSLLVLDYY